MRLKYRIKEALQFLAFAFYPKITLIVCAVFAVIVIGICAFMMTVIPQESSWYDIMFALTTGAAGSFFVSFVVELTSNYRHNKLAWNELKAFYSVIFDYERRKQIRMQLTPFYGEENVACEELKGAKEIDEIDEGDKSQDVIQITWSLLSEFIPVFKQTLDHKKEFLTDIEIDELQDILSEYNDIEFAIKKCILMSPMTYDALNHPDEGYLKFSYPSDVIKNMPDWMRKYLASKENRKACDRYVEVILSDSFLLSQFMEGYDISQNGLDSYQGEIDKVEKDEENGFEEIDYDELDYSEPADEESFRKEIEETSEQLTLESKPFMNWLLSKSCKRISEHIDILEKCVLEKPYYSMVLDYYRNYSKEQIDDVL